MRNGVGAVRKDQTDPRTGMDAKAISAKAGNNPVMEPASIAATMIASLSMKICYR